MQEQPLEAKPESLELSSSNSVLASELVREGRASLEVVAYPWGVEFAISLPCCPVERYEGGESDGV